MERNFTDPTTVVCPKHKIVIGPIILKNTEYDGFSIAMALWRHNNDDVRVVPLFRWNGNNASPLGSPNSHGQPTWQVIPEELLPPDTKAEMARRVGTMNFEPVLK